MDYKKKKLQSFSQIAIAFAALFAVCNAGVIPITSSIVQPIAPITQYSSEPVSVVAAAHQTIVAQPQTVIAAPNTLAYSAHHIASPISYASHVSVAHAAPLAYAAYSAPILSHHIAPSTIQIAHAPAAVEVAHAPVLAKTVQIAHHAPATVEVVAAPGEIETFLENAIDCVTEQLSISFSVPVVVAKGEATYVAKNLGAEHVAPLPGHDLSQTSLNLASAPGTL